jgi:hypothetical protein
MFHSKKGQKSEDKSLSDQEIGQLTALLMKANSVQTAQIATFVANNGTPSAAIGGGHKAPPGFYYDSKTGKTFRQNKPKMRSKVYQEAEQLQKVAAKNLASYCNSNGFLVVKDGDAKVSRVTFADGKLVTGKEAKELSTLQQAYENAKKQFKAVREFENSHSSTKKKQVKNLDPLAMPRITVSSDGKKLAWADDASASASATR